jgi:hypothetical protein
MKVSSNNDGMVNEDSDAVLQAECDDTEAIAGESAVPDPRNFPTVGGAPDPLPPAARIDTSPAAAAAEAARQAQTAAAQQPAALPATGMGPGETSSSFSWGAALSVVLLGVAGVTASLARRLES